MQAVSRMNGFALRFVAARRFELCLRHVTISRLCHLLAYLVVNPWIGSFLGFCSGSAGQVLCTSMLNWTVWVLHLRPRNQILTMKTKTLLEIDIERTNYA